MKYINPKTKKVVSIKDVRLATKTYTTEEQLDMFADTTNTTLVYSDMNVEAYTSQFFADLQAAGYYEGFIPESEYVNWPTDTELPEYDANYRVSLTSEQVVAITASESFRPLIMGLKTDYIKNHSKGVFVYLTHFEPYHPFILTTIVGEQLPICKGIVIELNPFKDVPVIDYTAPEWYTPPIEEPTIDPMDESLMP